MNNQITLTDRVLADMLTENTGAALLDSGGIYGRNWERNQGITVEQFIESPAVTVTKYGIDLNVFHYLRERVEFMPMIQEEFEQFAAHPDRKDDSWYEIMHDWRELYPCEYGGFNSYNDDCLLSQTIQGDYFEYEGEVYLMLQIHGGCDVRGGYTAPKIFREYEVAAVTYGWNSYSICSADDRKGEPVRLDFLHGEVYDADGEYLGDGYRWKKSEDEDPRLAWFDELNWDEAAEAFIAPDGDGHVEFIEHLPY